MTDHDAGLARIDEMLEDYVTWEGSADAGVWTADRAEDEHSGTFNELGYWSDDTPTSVTGSALPTVATPEEAEQGRPSGIRSDYWAQAQLYMQGFTPPRPQTQNTLALVLEAANRVRRERHDSVERAVLQMIEREMYRRIPDLQLVTVERDLDYMRTWVIARTENLQFRWAAVSNYEAPYDVHELVLTFHSMRERGSDWLRVEPRDNYFVYTLPVDHRTWLEQVAVDRLLRLERRTLDTTPITIGVSAEMMRRRPSIRGPHASLQVIDEVAQAFATVGQAGREAAARIATLSQHITTTSEEEEEPTAPPAAIPTPTVRPGLNGQRSTYGPPPRGRRR